MGDPKEAKDAKDAKKQGKLKRFLSSPYFKIIPTTHELEALKASKGEASEASEDYLASIKRLTLDTLDTDGVYGLTEDELVPLPFQAPVLKDYLIEILAGVYSVAQACVVMFLAINVENEDRGWKSGYVYSKNWLPIIKALIIVYPVVTLLWLVTLTVEYALRKAMYYRLLSMRILVDWENKKIWQGVFFYYFLAVWALINVWAIFGLAAYYNKNGNSGMDATSFGTFVVVNLQTIQLLIFYNRLIASEARLVSLNQVFERAPVEAQYLLTYTYVIEEADLRAHLYHFGVHMERAMLLRCLNLLTCGMAAGGWHAEDMRVKFDLYALRRKAANYNEVERMVSLLRIETLSGNNAVKARKRMVSASVSSAASPSAGAGPVAEGMEDPAVTAPHQVVMVDDGAGAREPGSPVGEGIGRGRLSDAEEAVMMGVDAPPPPPPPADEETPRPMMAFCCFNPLAYMYRAMYASLHSFYITVLPHYPTWAFRPDVPFFRTLTIIQMASVIAVGAIVVLGWLVSTSETSCKKAGKACNTCYLTHKRYFESTQPLCGDLEKSVTSLVGTTVGNWFNPDSGKQEPRYPAFSCAGNFTVA